MKNSNKGELSEAPTCGNPILYHAGTDAFIPLGVKLYKKSSLLGLFVRMDWIMFFLNTGLPLASQYVYKNEGMKCCEADRY